MYTRIPVSEAATAKGCSKQTIHAAIQDGRLKAEWLGPIRAVVVNSQYTRFEPKGGMGREESDEVL